MIRLKDVVRNYRQGDAVVRAVRGISLEVMDGEFLTIMGASGSGKSTLLHLIGGIDVPSSGEIDVAGNSLAQMNDDQLTVFRRRKIGFVFQFFNLLPTLTAAENVALPMLLDGKRLQALATRVDELLKVTGLLHRRDHMADQLSGGEMQRIAIARALIAEPDLLLADEPTGNLDSKRGEEILTMLKKINRQRGLTTVMVTHDPRAAAYSDRIIVIEDGKIASDSAAIECRHPFVSAN